MVEDRALVATSKLLQAVLLEPTVTPIAVRWRWWTRCSLFGATSAADPLQKNCEKLAAETFRRETADYEDRVDYRAHYNAHLNKCFYAETYIAPTPVGINMWVYLSDL
jgi:hypothetical protein